MNNAGIYPLAALQFTAPKALAMLTPVTNLAGMRSVALAHSTR